MNERVELERCKPTQGFIVVRQQGLLPCSYSTPRVAFSRVFFTMLTSSLLAEKTFTHHDVAYRLNDTKLNVDHNTPQS